VKRDYYDILGISRDADEATIKRAYRHVAMQNHPDKNPEDANAVHKMKPMRCGLHNESCGEKFGRNVTFTTKR
jgi:hypothetical protein